MPRVKESKISKLIVLVLTAGLWGATQTESAAAAGVKPAPESPPLVLSSIDLDREAEASEEPILFFRRTPSEPVISEPGPSIEIFADGRTIVRRPSFMTRPGVWQGDLPKAGISALFEDLATSGFFDLTLQTLASQRDALVLQHLKHARQNQDFQMLAMGDPDFSELTIRLEGYRLRGDLTSAGHPLHRVWTWWDLYTDARRLPGFEPLAAFARAQEKLIAWIDRDGMERVSISRESADSQIREEAE